VYSCLVSLQRTDWFLLCSQIQWQTQAIISTVSTIPKTQQQFSKHINLFCFQQNSGIFPADYQPTIIRIYLCRYIFGRYCLSLAVQLAREKFRSLPNISGRKTEMIKDFKLFGKYSQIWKFPGKLKGNWRQITRKHSLIAQLGRMFVLWKKHDSIFFLTF
jgi:hypothetical protein